MDRVPERLENYERPGFVIFTQREVTYILGTVLLALFAVDLARAFVRWAF